MSTAQENIQKLNSLLERIQARAAAPRQAPHADVGPQHVASRPAAAAPAVQLPPARPPMPSVAKPDFDLPPAEPEPMELEASVEAGEEMDYEVEVSSEVVEVDIDVDEVGERASHTQMVSASPADDDDDDDGGTLVQTSTEVYAADPAVGSPLGDEPPSSEPRPIRAEAAPFAAGAAEPERHTPPPESGRQVASASASPPARESRRPTPLPPSEHGTMIGGWREPGLAQQGAPQAQLPSPPPPAATPEPARATPGMAPQPIVPKIAKTGDVAQVAGPAPAIKPQSFGDLLDSSLEI